jgi:hypothetical protein
LLSGRKVHGGGVGSKRPAEHDAGEWAGGWSVYGRVYDCLRSRTNRTKNKFIAHIFGKGQQNQTPGREECRTDAARRQNQAETLAIV